MIPNLSFLIRPTFVVPLSFEIIQTSNFDLESETFANQNSDVRRSDLKDLRQSTVALGVSQKDGSNQIVKDWLETESGSGDSSENNSADTNEEIE